MTGWRKRQVLEMAREAGFEVHERKQQARVGLDVLCGIDSTAKLERFAELVRADERELCAKVCDEWAKTSYLSEAKGCARIIRERG